MAKSNKADMSCARVKKYTASDVSKAERHNERKNETYENINMIEERIPYNVHFKKPFAPTYMEQLKLIEEYVRIYGHDKWEVSTYDENIGLINNYILPTIGNTRLTTINTHFMEKYYKELLDMPAVKSTRNPDGTGKITESTVNEIHKILRSCFRQAVKWDLMEKSPAIDANVPKAKKEVREIWAAEMLMLALEACDNKMLKIAFHLAFTATLRIGELLGLTWDEMIFQKKRLQETGHILL